MCISCTGGGTGKPSALTHNFASERGELVFIEPSFADRQKLPAQNLRQLLPRDCRRVEKQRQVLQKKFEVVSLRDVLCNSKFCGVFVVFVPVVCWWSACCTTWQRPRHWGSDWYWRWPQEAENWPTPRQETKPLNKQHLNYLLWQSLMESMTEWADFFCFLWVIKLS